MIMSKDTLLHFAGASVAQWIEHESREVGDTGSSPVRGISPEEPHSFLGWGSSFSLLSCAPSQSDGLCGSHRASRWSDLLLQNLCAELREVIRHQ